IVVKRVDVAADDLGSGRAIDMDDRLDRPAPLGKDFGRDRHKTTSVIIDGIDGKDRAGIFFGYHRRERHEFGALQTPIEFVVGGPPRGIGKDRARAEGPRPKFHAPPEDRTDLTVGETGRSRLDWRGGGARPARGSFSRA